MDEQIITIDLNDGEFEISFEVIEEDLYLTSDAHLGSKETRSFSHFFEMKDMEASNWNLDDGKYRQFKIKDFKTKDRLDQSFRDDSKMVSFYYNNLGEGSKSRLNYTINIKDPRFLPAIYFSNNAPTITKKATLKVDEDIDIKLVEQNLKGFKVDFKKEQKRGYNYYYWESNNMEGMKYENGAPNFRRFAPHILPVITYYKNGKGDKVKLLDDVQGLYSWYSSLVCDINTAPSDPQLEIIVNNLTADKTNDLEKVRAIYYWTQENIKYIDFEYALGGFIPREANDVFLKKYGDCKDNSSIMKEMLKIAGLKGSLSWLGTRSIPYDYETVPTPSVDNHMILTYLENDKRYFLDATGRYQPLELPTSFIQGKQILIEDGKEDYILESVPVVDATINYRRDSVQTFLKNGELVGSGNSSFDGYYKLDLFQILERIDKAEKTKYLEVELQAGSNKFLIDSWSEKNLFAYNDPYELNYDFNVQNYVKTLGDEIYINLNLYKEAEAKRIDKSRELPLEYDYKNSYSVTSYFTIPDGYEVDYLPNNFQVKDDLIDAAIGYQQVGNQIIYQHSMSFHYLELSKEQQNTVNSLINSISPHYNEVVVLKKLTQ
jgi:hypothetical protein